MTETNHLRFGLIGAGMMGREHLRNLALIHGSTVTAIADPDAGSQKSALETTADSAAVFADVDALLDADMVRCAGHRRAERYPQGDPRAIFARAKPTSDPLRETVLHLRRRRQLAGIGGERLRRAALDRHGVPLHARHAALPRAGAGRHHRAQAYVRHPRASPPFLRKVGDWNRFARRTGGTLVEKCCHFFDLMRLIVGDEPVRVYASGAMDVNHLDERYNGETPDIIDNAFVVVDFRNGVRASLDLCMFADGASGKQNTR